MTPNIPNILCELEEDLKLISPELTDWNLNYFQNHQHRYKNDLRIIQKYSTRGRILEIGSLPCHLTYCLKKLNYSVIGLDISPERASDFIKKADIDVRKCDIETERIPFPDNSFNLIIFNETFEHLRIDPISTLKKINRVLKPSGSMILETPNLYSLFNIIKFNLGFGINNAYDEFEKLHSIGHMGHVRVYSTSEVIKFLQNTGFIVVKVTYKMNFSGKKKSGFRSLFKKMIDMVAWTLPKLRSHQVIISTKE